MFLGGAMEVPNQAIRSAAGVLALLPTEGSGALINGNHRWFILITPMKDEADSIRETVRSVVASDRRPDLWLIVDDGSSDGSADIVCSAAVEHEWIVPLASDRQGEYDWLSYAHVVQVGLEWIDNWLPMSDRASAIVGILDADTRVDHRCFATLIGALTGDGV